jgi:hypothetical protein
MRNFLYIYLLKFYQSLSYKRMIGFVWFGPVTYYILFLILSKAKFSNFYLHYLSY